MNEILLFFVEHNILMYIYIGFSFSILFVKLDFEFFLKYVQ
jgi:hypothetical protein